MDQMTVDGRHWQAGLTRVPYWVYQDPDLSALEQKRIRDNDLIMLCACGGGLTWGANILRW